LCRIYIIYCCDKPGSTRVGFFQTQTKIETLSSSSSSRMGMVQITSWLSGWRSMCIWKVLIIRLVVHGILCVIHTWLAQTVISNPLCCLWQISKYKKDMEPCDLLRQKLLFGSKNKSILQHRSTSQLPWDRLSTRSRLNCPNEIRASKAQTSTHLSGRSWRLYCFLKYSSKSSFKPFSKKRSKSFSEKLSKRN